MGCPEEQKAPLAETLPYDPAPSGIRFHNRLSLLLDWSKSVEINQEIEAWELDDSTWVRIGGRNLENGVSEPVALRYLEP